MSESRVITEWSGDPRCCPLCGADNACAMAGGEADPAKPLDCWCVDAAFPPDLLSRVPLPAQGKACVCAACAARAAREGVGGGGPA